MLWPAITLQDHLSPKVLDERMMTLIVHRHRNVKNGILFDEQIHSMHLQYSEE